MNKIITKVITGLFVVLMMSTTAQADDDSDSDSDSGGGNNMYKVTITNLTQAEKFTPILVASSRKRVKLFDLGEPASPELARLAEGGAVDQLTALLEPHTVDIADSFALLPPHGLLEPGDSVTVMVSAQGAKYISLASMLIPTNDAFFALNGVRLKGKNNAFMAKAYDAGSETNTEACVDIPGPDCGGTPFSPLDEGEGYVYIHSGIQGNGNLAPEIYDWNNPVAHVEIVRVK
jgi:hypothetical protein